MSETDYWKGWADAATFLADPYPADVFTPLTEDEIRAAVEAMNGVVRHASERMHAAWARHWSEALIRDVPEAVHVSKEHPA